MVLGGVLVATIGLAERTRGESGSAAGPTTSAEPRRAADCAPSMHGIPVCPDPPPAEPMAAKADGRTLLLELQKAESDAALAELGGRPMEWSQVLGVPEDLLPDRFEALVSRVASELGAAAPEIDCSEFPCVVVAPVEWTSEQFAALRERVQDGVEVDEPQLFGLDHGGTRVFGVYSQSSATSELLKRIWFRTSELRREAEVEVEVRIGDGDER